MVNIFIPSFFCSASLYLCIYHYFYHVKTELLWLFCFSHGFHQFVVRIASSSILLTSLLPRSQLLFILSTEDLLLSDFVSCSAVIFSVDGLSLVFFSSLIILITF